VRPNGMEDTSQYHLYVDQQKAEALGVDISTINATMSTMFGGTYVNDFIDRGRVKKVYIQSDAQFRMLPQNISEQYVRNNNG
ncbi:efflux RND transporter permease subunit, partial [Klebsiella pneumoniae]|nr:efflux RND transporter permease subunit [Klebsiella pneumoniae]